MQCILKNVMLTAGFNVNPDEADEEIVLEELRVPHTTEIEKRTDSKYAFVV